MEEEYNVFLSWAGTDSLSHRVAKILHRFLPLFHPELKPFISDEISKGQPGLTAIHNAMNQVKAGIVCVTERSQHQPWLLYELGYLHAKINSVCPLLIELDLPISPIREIQFTALVKDDFVKMIRGVVQKCGLTDIYVTTQVDSHWNDMYSQIQCAISQTQFSDEPEKHSDLANIEQHKTIEDELEWNVYSTDLVNQFFHDSEFRTYPSLDKRAYISELFIADKVTRQELFSIIIETRYNSSSSILGYENSYTVLLIDKEKNAKIRIYPQSPEEKEILSMEMLLHHPEKGRCGFPFSNKNISSYRLKKERQKEDRERKYRISNGTASPADVLQEQMSSMNVETLTKILHGKSSVNGN